MANTHEHLEHAEHAGHHASDPFDRRVAVTMAIIAACLAGISTLGHRKHNDVLRVQGEANRFRTEEARFKVEASNNWARYQAKRNREAMYQTALAQAKFSPAEDKAARAAQVVEWDKAMKELREDPKRPNETMPAIQDQAREAEAAAAKAKENAVAKDAEAEHDHHQADRLDLGHLLAEIGLVVCSVAILSKRRSYWLTGIASAALAVGVAGSAYMIAPHPPHADTHAPADAHGKADGHGPEKPEKGSGHDKPKSEKDPGHEKPKSDPH